MATVVQKFGGSSVADAQKILRVAKRVGETADQGNRVVVIVSAMGDTTDELIDLAAQLSQTPAKREMDRLLATGEMQSIALLAIALESLGYKAVSLSGRQAGYHTDGVFSKARIINIDSSRVEEELNKGNIVVVAGFQGVDHYGDITTLGRGGSDTSAVAMAASLGADVCEIYTDVDGVYTADPRVVPKAQKMEVISYDEMLEMAAMGALVMQPRSVEVAKSFNLKLHVRSSFNHNLGTIIQEVGNLQKQVEKDIVVCGVAHDVNVVKVAVYEVPSVPGIASKMFTTLAGEKINVDMVVQGGIRDGMHDVAFTVGKEDKEKTKAVLEKLINELPAQSFELDDDVAKVSIVGAGMITNPGVAAKMFQVLADLNCNIHMISTSEIKVSCIVDKNKVTEVVQALHTAFGLDA